MTMRRPVPGTARDRWLAALVAAAAASALVPPWLSGCSREAASKGSTESITLASQDAAPLASRDGGAPKGPTAPLVPSLALPPPGPPHPAETVLAKFAIELELPHGWELVAKQSDETVGLVAFAPDVSSPEPGSAFLDGSLSARVPASLEEAAAEALQSDDCKKPAECVVLAKETLAGGFLVSLRTPQAVSVESWLALAPEHAVRCGFEMAALHAPIVGGATWLDDPLSVARARGEGEAICRSVRAAR